MQTQTESSTLRHATRLTIEGLQYKLQLFSTCLDPLFTDTGCPSILQSRGYHAALESSPPENMAFWYVRIDQEDTFTGMLSFQVKDFNPGDSLRNQVNGNPVNRIRYGLASRIQLKVLCLGNTLVTGDYGFCFQPHVEDGLRTSLMMEAIEWMLGLKAFRKIGLVFVKDFYTDIFHSISGSPYCKKYHAIETQPNMIMQLSPAWSNQEDYLASLKSKYRVRARKALELASHLERIELDTAGIRAVEDQLHQLYLKVVDDVGFNLFVLSKGYFTALKASLGDRFRLWIYKDQGELISFFTVFEDGDTLDAHFLGYDPQVNQRHKLYLNMLLAMIDYAARHQFRELQLSRTATEIKSSVGAEGIPMWAYMRFPRKGLNWSLPYLYALFKPDLAWEPRHPFLAPVG